MSLTEKPVQVIIAAGSNLGDREAMIRQAGAFLESISAGVVLKSSIWETDPMGPSRFPFLNAVAKIEWPVRNDDSLVELLRQLKAFERECGRPDNPERWGPRVLDLDIIAVEGLSVQQENLEIPHPEYSKRWFVLAPLQEIAPEWVDPITSVPIQEMLEHAEPLAIRKTDLSW